MVHKLGGRGFSVFAASRLPGKPFALNALRAAFVAPSAEPLTDWKSVATSSRYLALAARMCCGSTYRNRGTMPTTGSVRSGSAEGRTIDTHVTSARVWSAGTDSM